MAKRLEGKNIIVVGGTSGMGESQVYRFIEEGANVIVANRSVDKGLALVENWR